MNASPDPASSGAGGFHSLTYDQILHLVEEVLRTRCTNWCRPLNSYINRVYEVHPAAAAPVIVKFFRPGRWSREALLEEQEFLFELDATEVPVIRPIGDAPSSALHQWEGVQFALYPKQGGRICEEPTPEQWRQLGRLMGRVHQVGAAHAAPHRVHMHPEHVTADQIEFILSSGLVGREHRQAYEDAAWETVELIAPAFDDVDFIRLHGDVHRQNLIHRPDEPFTIIDFDDMAMGPAVQDVWMLLPGRPRDCRYELDCFLAGYEVFRPFEPRQLRLIEPLRAMRYIHFAAWCARQAADGGFTRLAADWGAPAYWRQEIDELRRQHHRIREEGAG